MVAATIKASKSNGGCKSCKMIKDLTGQVFGGYRFIGPMTNERGKSSKHVVWLVRCENCGREKKVLSKQKKVMPKCACAKGIPTGWFCKISDNSDIDNVFASCQKEMRIKEERIQQLRQEQENILKLCEQFKGVFCNI